MAYKPEKNSYSSHKKSGGISHRFLCYLKKCKRLLAEQRFNAQTLCLKNLTQTAQTFNLNLTNAFAG